VPEAERIRSLDVLRGVAVLGVLWMNMRGFADPLLAYGNPRVLGEFTGANYWVWYVGQVLAQNKFFTIFSMLFGAGIVLMTGRQKASRWRVALLHYRRMFALLLIGAAHAFLLWSGDVLMSYALCGLWLFFLRRLWPWVLVTLGVLLMVAFSGFGVYRYATRDRMPEEQRQELARRLRPDPEMLEQERAAYLGGWGEEIRHRGAKQLGKYRSWGLLFGVFGPGAIMLLGMGLFKLGAFSAALSRRAYLALVVAGALVGLPACAYGVWVRLQVESPADLTLQRLVASLVFTWGSLLAGLGYVGAVMLACQSPRLRPWTSPFSAVGRMALTNYLMHSLICTEVFYGRGLGYFGRVDQVGQAGLIVAIAAFQLAASPLWLRYFRFGPVEWLWRSLTYLSLQPMRRATPSALAA
jgi:uncharacterized protein